MAMNIVFSICMSILVVTSANAAGPDDVTASIGRFLDAFNKGDMKTAYASYAAGDIDIVDEFPPHRWTGPNAAHLWAADYDKNAAATGHL